jgi:AraC-like DNA-binding protein
MLFWLNPWTRLDMTWPDRLVFTELWFRLVHQGRNVRLPESHWVLPDAGPTLELFHQIEQELTVDLPDSDRKRRCLLSLLTIEVTRMRSPAGRAIMSLNSPQQRRLLAYIRENLAGRPTVEDLADVVELSPDYFSRVFRQAFGVPPRDLMIRERIREAARLLSTTNLSVNQVAERLGYANVSQFSRQFRQHTGRPPRRYRLRR